MLLKHDEPHVRSWGVRWLAAASQRATSSEEQLVTLAERDDSALVRQTLEEIISSDPCLEVMASAADPIIAAEAGP